MIKQNVFLMQVYILQRQTGKYTVIYNLLLYITAFLWFTQKEDSLAFFNDDFKKLM